MTADEERARRKRREKQAAAAILLLEFGARKRLRSALHEAASNYRDGGALNAIAAGNDVARATSPIIVDLRSRAAAEGARITRASLADFGVKAKALPMAASHAQRAEFLASRLGGDMAKRTRIWDSSTAAAAKIRGRVDTIATTETALAFQQGQRAELLAAANDNAQAVALLVQRWNAVLDRMTCSICSALDGKTVGLNESFPQTPGAVHARCRCFVTIERRR